MADCKGNKTKFVSIDSENVGKKYLERVTHIENHVENFCSVFSGYNMKVAQLRDKNDEIAKCLHKFAVEEPFETTTKLTVQLLSQIVATVGDYRDAEVERLDGKVLSSLTTYGEIFKYMKSDIRKAMTANKKESERRKDLEKFLIKRKETKYHEAIGLAENALERALTESSHLNEQIQEQMIKFEHKRLVDVKESLERFLRVEIAACAKLVELFTEAFQTVHNIDVETDLEIIREGLKLPATVSLFQTQPSSKKTKPPNVEKQKSFISTGLSGSARNYKNSRDKIVPTKAFSETTQKMPGFIRQKGKEIGQRNKMNNCFTEQGNIVLKSKDSRREGKNSRVDRQESISYVLEDRDDAKRSHSVRKHHDMSDEYVNETNLSSTSPVSNANNFTDGEHNLCIQNGKMFNEKEKRRGFAYEGNKFPLQKSFKIETTRQDGSHRKFFDGSKTDMHNAHRKKRVSFSENESEPEYRYSPDREKNYKRALSPAPNNKKSVLKKEYS